MHGDGGFETRFRKAYESLFPIIFRVALRISGESAAAEDLCHEAFLRYYEKGRSIPDLEQVKYWLIRVVKNLSFNLEKRKGREWRAVQRLGRGESAFSADIEERLVRENQERAVQELLREVPHNLRVCLILKEYENLTYREIGSILGISENNVKVRVFRGREKLGKLFKERFGIES